MKIEMGKLYKTQGGRSVRILCTDRKNMWPVVALVFRERLETLETYTEDGCFFIDKAHSPMDLIEVVPWDNLKVDDPVYVRQTEQDVWKRRHFAGIKDGKPATWTDGYTSWTAPDKNDVITWNYCSPAGAIDND